MEFTSARNITLFVVFEFLVIALANIPALILLVMMEGVEEAGLSGILFLSLTFAVVQFFLSILPLSFGAIALHFMGKRNPANFAVKSLVVGLLVGVIILGCARVSGLANSLMRFDPGSLAFFGSMAIISLFAWQLLALRYLRGNTHGL